ncbi:MAG: NupC/NupG family nucleoside CNT transporter [Bacteroidota bacterium]
MIYLRGLIGIVSILAIAVLFSRKRKDINWRLVGVGMALQFALGVLILKVLWFKSAFAWLAEKFVRLLSMTDEGSKFVFGWLVEPEYQNSFGIVFAFKILPIIIFFSALTSLLYHIGLLQLIVKGFAWMMSKLMRLSGAESLSAAGNVFLGQTEAPLLIKPYLNKLSMSELMSVMTGGMATIAGSVLGAYVGFLGGADSASQTLFATHLLSASIISAPAAIVCAKLLYPEDPNRELNKSLKTDEEKPAANLLEAITIGAGDGLRLAANVAVMLIAFIALIALVNWMLGAFGNATELNAWVADYTNGRFDQLSLEFILGMMFQPIAWLIGIEWGDTLTIGSLLGIKTAANEFIAYEQLGKLEPGMISMRSRIITTYALCGFANFASIAIQIGGIGALAPARRRDLSKLGLLSLLGGTLACLLTAALAGMLISAN